MSSHYRIVQRGSNQILFSSTGAGRDHVAAVRQAMAGLVRAGFDVDELDVYEVSNVTTSFALAPVEALR